MTCGATKKLILKSIKRKHNGKEMIIDLIFFYCQQNKVKISSIKENMQCEETVKTRCQIGTVWDNRLHVIALSFC